MHAAFAGCVIKAARETAALMFGVPVSEMVGHELSEFLPLACPSRNAEDMLIVGDTSQLKRGGMGGSGQKKVVGKLMPMVGICFLHVSLLSQHSIQRSQMQGGNSTVQDVHFVHCS